MGVLFHMTALLKDREDIEGHFLAWKSVICLTLISYEEEGPYPYLAYCGFRRPQLAGHSPTPGRHGTLSQWCLSDFDAW